jgi:hypothetical protein
VSIVPGLLAIASSIFSLGFFTAEAQTIPIPEFAPKTPGTAGSGDSETAQSETQTEPPRPTDFAMKVQLEPHENELLADDGYYEVSDFALAPSNSSELCPTGSCEFEFEGGQMSGEVEPGERQLTGKLNVITGDTTRILDVLAFLNTVEERQQNGDTIEVIEGTLDASRDPANTEYQSEINGTLTPDGSDRILEIHGTAGSPYDLGNNEQTSSADNEEPLEQLEGALGGLMN